MPYTVIKAVEWRTYQDGHSSAPPAASPRPLGGPGGGPLGAGFHALLTGLSNNEVKRHWDGYRHAIFSSGFKSPLLDGFDRLLIKPQSRATQHFDIGGSPVDADFKGELYDRAMSIRGKQVIGDLDPLDEHGP